MGATANPVGQSRGNQFGTRTGVAAGISRNVQSASSGANHTGSSSSDHNVVQQEPAALGNRNCYRCDLPGHGVKECKSILLYVVCGKSTHITGNCVLPSQPKPVAALIGGGADGLQMFTSLTSKKIESDKSKQAIAIVTVHSGGVNAQQLVDAFSKQFQWGWEWKAKPYLKNSFLVKFPSVQKIDEMKAFNYFGLVGHKATVRVNRWTNSYMAKYKLYTVWVKVSRILETMLHYQGFCEAASLSGKVFAINMELYRSCDIIRAKVGVKDPRKIPFSAPLNDEEYIYDIFFELEDIVEEGGPMIGGVLVSNNDTVRPSQDSANTSGELKRPRDNSQAEASQNSKSPKNSNNSMGEDEHLVDEQGEQFVPSSQEELDKNIQEEMETRKKLLIMKDQQGSGSKAIDDVNAKFANVSARLDSGDLEDDEELDCTENPDSFAKKLGLGTQAIERINEEVAREEAWEAENNKENKGPDLANLKGNAVVDVLDGNLEELGANRGGQGQ
ncbi:hypothetical protein ACQ4PT_014167 [Festuca glaucescens]